MRCGQIGRESVEHITEYVVQARSNKHPVFSERASSAELHTLGVSAKVSRHFLRELSVWLSLDDFLGIIYKSCFVGPDGFGFSVGKREMGGAGGLPYLCRPIGRGRQFVILCIWIDDRLSSLSGSPPYPAEITEITRSN
jgi:hypothetical protein